MRAGTLSIDPLAGIVYRTAADGTVGRADLKIHNRGGYRTVSVKRQTWRLAHLLIWESVNGPVPDGFEIDHMDGDPTNNSILNLRAIPHRKNCENHHRPNKNSTSGVKGVSWDKRLKKWRAHITVNYRLLHLGMFTDKEDAVSAYAKAAALHHTHNPHAEAD